MKMNRRNLNYILIGLTSILLIILVFVYMARVVPLKDDLKLAHDTLKTEEDILAAIEQNVIAFSQSDEEIEELLKEIPPVIGMEYWLQDIELIEKDSGVTIDRMTFSINDTELFDELEDEEETDPETESQLDSNNAYQKIDISLTVEATSYEELYNFVNEIENLTRLTSIESMSFSSPIPMNENESIIMDIALSTFSFSSLAEHYPDFDLNYSFNDPEGREHPF